ncbi:MAG TPA: L-seryl-tRNA(Sec) selenium transferase [Actinomycetota bacterium]|jgi:L-seryl-tRNA(Ser) seleniumtransferase
MAPTDVSQAGQLRKLPRVDRLLEQLGNGIPRPVAAEVVRGALDEARAAIAGGAPAPSAAAVLERARQLADAARRRGVVVVVNATGVLLHTNLGRSPLSPAALAAVADVGAGYSNLEFDLAAGHRGSRYDHATDLLVTLVGAEAALVVNNNAAAVLLVLAAVARGREVIVSRGELIEIGGEFRIPDILAESGATLVEVGTTNRTHRRDYDRALTEATGAIMKVHPSNYQVVGFTASVPPRELATLAHERGVPLVHDAGSGLLRRRVAGRDVPWLASEPAIAEAVAEGADIVTFSGDKLLGGPQCGVIVGRRELIDRMRTSPLLRAFRVDKTTLVALEATLAAYLDGREADLPLWQMALAPHDEIKARAAAVVAEVGAGERVAVADGWSTTGGGSVPGAAIPTAVIRVDPRGPAAPLVRALLDNDPPIVARVEEEQILLDLRTVLPSQDPLVVEALRRLAS